MAIFEAAKKALFDRFGSYFLLQLGTGRCSPSNGTPDENVPLLQENSVETAEHLQSLQCSKVDMTCGQKCFAFLPSFWNISAVFIKNLNILRRNIGFLLFQFLLPSIQIILFCLCIGQEPYGLRMAVVNNETSSPFHMGARFLKYIDNTSIIQQKYTEMSAAVDSVRRGENWGVIGIGENFTQDLTIRFLNPTQEKLDNKTVEGGTIHLYLDMTNQQIYLTIQSKILLAFQTFAANMLSLVGKSPELASLPVKIDEAIYGDLTPSFTNFMAPGIIISVIFFLATGLTALSFVLERKMGLLDRSRVAGVNPVEIMIAHIGVQFLIMAVQVALLLIFSLVVFQVPSRGPVLLVIILTLFQGFLGMALGLLISAVCDEENSAIQLALGSVYPNLLLSGIIWPLEAMPVWLRYIGICLPMTLPTDAMRSVLLRGWDLTYMPVWRGFLVSIGWGWGLMAISAIILKIRGT